jgi:hypothetical protein
MVTIKQMLDALHSPVELSTARELAHSLELIDQVQSLSSQAIAALRQLYLHGPVEDGDLCSKSGRDTLLNLGMASKCIVKAQEGYQVCTYKGMWAGRLLDLIASDNELEAE